MVYTQDYKTMFTAFYWLMCRDVRVLRKNFINNFIDGLFIPIGIGFVSGYVMPAMGLPLDYGLFMFVSTAVGMGFNSTGTDAGNLVADLDGDKSISYELALPLPYWLVCIKTALVYAIKSAVMNFLIFPFGLVLFWHNLSYDNIFPLRFLIIFIGINILFGFFALLVALWAKNIESYGRFWIRWGWTIFILAGFNTSWFVTLKAMPYLAYVNLINPLMYCFEGGRATILGQERALNYWICLLAILLFIGFFVFASIRLFKRRLDCV